MRKMNEFLVLNYGWLLLAVIGLVLAFFALTMLKKPVSQAPTTKSANFADDPVVGNPVVTHSYVNVFNEAARAAIEDSMNPWIYLRKEWSKAKEMNGVEPALLDFITNEAHRKIPDSSSVTLSVRDYSDPNSIVMEYLDPDTDSIMITTGHDPEPALYATFANKADSATFKLICANGLVRELGGKVTTFNHDYVIKAGDSFIGITGSTPHQASKFAEENDLPVRFVIEGRINSKTPNTSRVKVFGDYKNFRKGIFDVVLQPGDILRKQDGKWFYIRN